VDYGNNHCTCFKVIFYTLFRSLLLFINLEKAPKPKAVYCKRIIKDRPEFYGYEFHGLIDRKEAERLLKEVAEGAYLVRASRRTDSGYTLCIFFEGKILNYKLYYDRMHYVAEKRLQKIN
jgi:hypothetical protein